MDENLQQQLPQLLNSVGLASGNGDINWANLIGGIIFGTIGMVAFMYGKKQRTVKPLIIGVALMGYPYFTPNTFLLYLIGITLSAILFFWKD